MNRSFAVPATILVLALAGCSPAAATPSAAPSVATAAAPTPASTSTPTPTTAASPSSVATATASTSDSATASANPALAPGDPWLAFQADDQAGYGVHLIRPDGTGEFSITAAVPGREQLHPDWSPDGTKMVFSVGGDASRDLWVTDANGGNADRIVTCDECDQVDEPAWSPDGRSIAFHREGLVGRVYQSTLEIYDVATRTSRVVLTAASDRVVFAPRWSPDGTRLVMEYVHRKGTTAEADFDGDEIGIVDLTAAKPTFHALTKVAAFGNNPDWSPAGDLIVFSQPAIPPKLDAEADLWTMRPDGTHLARITRLADQGSSAVMPTFTPDGRRIVFDLAKVAGGDSVMATVAIDGSDLQPAVTSGFLGGLHARFRPTP